VQGVEQLLGLFGCQHRPFVHLDRRGVCESYDVASDIAPALGLSESPAQDRAGKPLRVSALPGCGEHAAHLLDVFRCDPRKADVAEMGPDVEIDDLPVAAPGRCLQLARGVEAVQPLVEPCGHGHVAACGDDALVPGVLGRLELGLNLSLCRAVHRLPKTLAVRTFPEFNRGNPAAVTLPLEDATLARSSSGHLLPSSLRPLADLSVLYPVRTFSAHSLDS